MEDKRKNPNRGYKWVEWYVYRGGVTDTTREFCRKRNGEYFHFKEIMDFAKEDWEGKHPKTTERTIFKYSGGFCNVGDIDETCHHVFMPTSISAVPKDAIRRNIAKGYLKLKEAEMRILDLI